HMRAKALRGQPSVEAELGRVRRYVRGIVTQWSLVSVMAVLCVAESVGLTELGLRLPTSLPGAVGAAIFVGAALTLLIVQARYIAGSAEVQALLREQVGGLDVVAPRSAVEFRVFLLVSVTAGICEELLYRGFLVWYLDALIGWWPALLVSTLLFGLAHAYQGVVGVAKTTVVGLILAGLLAVSGTLVFSMVLHVLIDALNGVSMYMAMRERLER
ncbi:MAG: membrane protease YdiL (CAAX protease family), partial [Kiritimatiellia bacterium]